MIRYLTFLTVAVCAFSAYAVKSIVLSRYNYGELSKNIYDLIIVKDSVILPAAEIAVTNGKRIHFEDNGFIAGVGAVVLRLDNTTIDAPRRRIFADNIYLSGWANNTEIYPEWFGDVTGDDASPAINKALASLVMTTVSLGNGVYNIGSPIIFKENSRRFKCPGHLRLAGKNDTIMKLFKLYHDIDVGVMESAPGCGYHGVGIHFADVANSNINVGRLLNLEKGFDLTPELYPAQNSPNGIQYNTVTWQFSKCKYNIYFNQCKNMSPTVKLWINENRFYGGRMVGAYGIYFDDSDMRPELKGVDYINGNVFHSVGFEGITENCIRLRHCQFDNFYDLRMSNDLPTGDKPWIDLEDCIYVNIGLKSGIPYNRVKADKDCFAVTLTGVFTDNGLNFYRDFDKMVLFSSGYNGKGPTTKFLTTSLQARNMIDSIVINSSNCPATPVPFTDLYVRLYGENEPEQVVLSDLCSIAIKQGCEFKVDFTNSRFMATTPWTLLLNIEGNGKFSIYENGRLRESITVGGCYRFSYNSEMGLSVVHIVD